MKKKKKMGVLNNMADSFSFLGRSRARAKHSVSLTFDASAAEKVTYQSQARRIQQFVFERNKRDRACATESIRAGRA
ncbi:MAG: hypothetical protein HKN58_01690 [Xanthomonadales bacterium]|nr:hypothetical protein [Xanthomonadales bacterium]